MHLSQARVRVGRVLTLARFPVKSTAGEVLQTVEVDQRGLVRDRGWAVYTADGGIASGKTSRRFRKIDGLMKWRSTAPADSNDVPQLHSPRGSSYSVDDPRAAEALTHNFGQPLTLRPERSMSHYDDCPIHLVTTSSIRQIESFIGSPESPILKALGDVHEVILGVKATVAQTGSIAVHDDAYLLR